MALTLQWLAGFFDGEGYIGVAWNKSHKTFYPRLTISNTHLPTLEMIQEQFGGSLHRSWKKLPKSGKQCYSLHWGHKSVRELLEKIAPFLVVKKEQVDAILQQWNWNKPKWIDLTEAERTQRVQLASTLQELKRKNYTLKEEEVH